MNAAARLLLLLLLPGLLLPVAALAARTYGPELSLRDAQQAMFPAGTRFRAVPAAEVRRRVAATPRTFGENYSAMRHLQLWEAEHDGQPAGLLATDAVIGKFEKIDYAVALDTGGRVLQVLVLKYRESHGQEVRRPQWLAQFEGKHAGSPLRLREDIDNITGATLSCVHLTDGVRRITRVLAPAGSAAP